MGGPTPDDTHGGTTDAELVVMRESGQDPTNVGELRLNAGALKARDGAGVFDLRSGSGLSEAQHEALDTLAHRLAETRHTQVTRSGGRIVTVVEWTDNTETTKVRELAITRASGKVSQVVEKQYDGTGTLVQTLTGVVNRVSGRVDSIDWTET